MAQDASLSPNEKIGFPDSYRAGYGEAMFADIRRKLTQLERAGQIVLDIGPGCSDLPHLMIDLCREKNHTLILVDAPEMLDQLPDAPFVVKIPAYFPDGCPQLFADYAWRVNAMLSYSVLHHVFAEGNIFRFLDQSLTLLANEGQFLIGDIPNVSKRKRFFSAETGVRFHQNFMQTTDTPEVAFNQLEPDTIDDSAVFGLMLRARLAGFDSYLLPQAGDLPMANRREDLLFVRP